MAAGAQGRGGRARSSAHDSASARPLPRQHARDLGNERATWVKQKEVATSFWHRDQEWRSWRRDILFGVATWLRLGLKGPES